MSGKIAVNTLLRSFDGTERVAADLRRPDRFAALRAELAAGPFIVRGAGLSYCAAAAGPRTIAAGAFDRLLSFDDATGVLEVEAGATLGKVFSFSAARGWLLPVMPGHPSITVGGCIGANVHGKNQHREGNFAAVVDSLRLFHPDHGEVLCSRSQRRELFELTLGGFGLTGFVLSARLKLQRLGSGTYILARTPVRSLEQAVEVMKAQSDAESLYSWHRLGADNAGRGFVYSARQVEGALPADLECSPLDPETRGRWRVSAFNALTAPAVLWAYGLSEALAPERRSVSVARVAFPVSGREFYFKLFGARGFREYQVLFPWPAWPEACRRLPALLRSHPAPITLASLKIFGGRARYLNFEGEGVCLALDAPDSPVTRALWGELDELVAGLGGCVNVCKDSRLSAATARRLFPELEAFKAALAAWDPARRLDSALRGRLEL